MATTAVPTPSAMSNYPHEFIAKLQQLYAQSVTGQPMPIPMPPALLAAAAAVRLGESAFRPPGFDLKEPMEPPENAFRQITSSSDDSAPGGGGQEDKPKKRSRLGGSSVKTAEVWKYFKQLPPPDQAASCDRCHKTIKATNSSTTGMIRHLRSCHPEEYQQLQAARSLNELDKTLKNVPDEAMRDQLRRAYEKSHGATLMPSAFNRTGANAIAPPQVDTSIPEQEPPNSNGNLPVKMPPIHSVASIIGTPMASPIPQPHMSAFMPALLSPQQLQNFLMETLRSKQQQLPADLGVKQEPQAQQTNVLKRTASLEDHSELSSPASSRKSSSPKQPKIEQITSYSHLAEEKSEESTPAVPRRKEKSLRETNSPSQWPDNHKEAKKLTDQIALMILLDGLPVSVIGGAGFRAMVKFLVPQYRVPSEEYFSSKVLPVVQQQLIDNNVFPPIKKVSTSSIPPRHERSGVSPATTIESGFVESDSGHEEREEDTSSLSSDSRKSGTLDNLLNSARAAQNISHDFSFSLAVDACPDSRKELDDSDTSSSVDSEGSFQPKMDEFLDFVGRYVFPQNDLLDLSMRCYHLFESTDLREQLALGDSQDADSVAFEGDAMPHLARCIAFVASNVDAINTLHERSPNPPFRGFDANERQFLLDLNAHIQGLRRDA